MHGNESSAVPQIAWRPYLKGYRGMTETRQRFDREFRGAVRMARETGKPIAQVSREAGSNPDAGQHQRILTIAQAIGGLVSQEGDNVSMTVFLGSQRTRCAACAGLRHARVARVAVLQAARATTQPRLARHAHGGAEAYATVLAARGRVGYQPLQICSDQTLPPSSFTPLSRPEGHHLGRRLLQPAQPPVSC